MTGFTPDGGSLIPFGLDMSTGGTLMPIPEVGDDRVRIWEADIILANGTDAANLRSHQVSVTARPAIGAMDHGTIIIEGKNVAGNPGRFGDLTIPTNMDGAEQVWRAALSICSLASEANAAIRRASVTFIVGNRVS